MKARHETQKEKIFKYLKNHSTTSFKASTFMQFGTEHCVGYEAPIRIGDICRLGLVANVGRYGRFALYQITEKGMKTDQIPKSNLIQVGTP